jgi:large subunit ribosomal protein L29
MKYADISGLADKEIQKKVTQLQNDVFEAKMKNSLGQLANPMEIRNNRRDIARLKTAMAAKSAAKTKAAKGQ